MWTSRALGGRNVKVTKTVRMEPSARKEGVNLPAAAAVGLFGERMITECVPPRLVSMKVVPTWPPAEEDRPFH